MLSVLKAPHSPRCCWNFSHCVRIKVKQEPFFFFKGVGVVTVSAIFKQLSHIFTYISFGQTYMQGKLRNVVLYSGQQCGSRNNYNTLTKEEDIGIDLGS